MAGKLARAVPRGLGGSNPTWLLDGRVGNHRLYPEVWHRSSKASGGEDVQLEEAVSRWDFSSFHFHATLALQPRTPGNLREEMGRALPVMLCLENRIRCY